MKWRNLQKIAKFLKDLGYQDNFWTKFPLKFALSQGHFNKFLYIFFNFMKKSCLALKLCHFKVQRLDFPMKMVR